VPRDPHPERPPAQRHGERHVTGSEPESGGQRNAEFIAARVAEAAAGVDAHIVLCAGDQHILDAVSRHLPGSLGPITSIASGHVSEITDDRLGAALDEITAAAIDAVADLASSAGGPDPAAVRGVEAVAEQLAAQQVAVLFVAAGIGSGADLGPGYRIGSYPAALLAGDSGEGTPVPLDADGGEVRHGGGESADGIPVVSAKLTSSFAGATAPDSVIVITIQSNLVRFDRQP
jgi:hypothetical protein